MYNNNLLKSGNIVKNEETRVIDSNTMIAERLATLSRILGESALTNEADEEENFEGFSAGLDAVQVEQLLGDPDDMSSISQSPDFDMQAEIQNTADAQNEAEAILSAAREEADRIVAQANETARGIEEEARAKGHGEGYQAGYDEGLQIAKEAEEECGRKIAEMEALYNQKIEELEPEFVEKLTNIYEQIFMVDLSERKELVLYLLSNAIRNIEGGKTFLVHVSKEDYEYVSEHKAELTRGLPGTSIFEVIEDLTLEKAQCFIEADSGIFDASLGVELSLLKKELMLLSYRP